MLQHAGPLHHVLLLLSRGGYLIQVGCGGIPGMQHMELCTARVSAFQFTNKHCM